jgi:hypothetical protein
MMGTDALEVAVLRSIFDDVTGDRVVEIVAFTGGDDQSVGIILTELRISAADVQVRRYMHAIFAIASML